MTARVPYIPPGLLWRDVFSGEAVRGRTWQSAAELVNWLNGRGSQLAVCHRPGITVSPGSTRTFNYVLWPRYQSTQRAWIIRAKPSNTAYSTRLNITTPDGIVLSPGLGSGAISGVDGVTTYVAIEDVATRVAGYTEVQLTIEVPVVSNGTGAVVEQISCVEVPRVQLELDAGEYAVNGFVLTPGQPIFDGSGGEGVHEVGRAVHAALYNARRAGMFTWAVPTNNAPSTTGTTPSDFFLLDPPALGRKLFDGDTTRRITWAVYAQSSGRGGKVHAGGDTIDVTGSYAWYGPQTFTVDAEDLDQAGGLVGGVHDALGIQWNSVAGDSLSVASICIGEAPLAKGESGWSAANYYEAADGNLEGSSSMTRVVLFRLDAIPGTEDYLFAKGTGSSGGWSLRVTSSGELHWRVSGSTAARSAFGASDVGKVFVAVGTYDGTNIRLYLNGALEDTTALASYTANATATNIGAYGGGSGPANNCTIIACAASDSTVMAEDAVDYYAACQTLADVAWFEGIEHLWSKRCGGDFTADLIGSLTFTKNGSPTDEGPFDPTYG